MLTGVKRVIIADTESIQNPNNGDRKKRVTRAKIVVANVELVGINTAQVGQVQGFNLAYSITVKRVIYGKEKFLYFDGALYEIKTMGKTKHPIDMLLNVQVSNDTSAKAAVEEWIANASS
ncbi:MAG: hypothetical protein K2N23_06995 [Clostridia bacterium]|nr:hypothetical protein [Clostridia bacterium]